MFINSILHMPILWASGFGAASVGVAIGSDHDKAAERALPLAAAALACLVLDHPAAWIAGGAALLASYHFINYKIAPHRVKNDKRAREFLEGLDLPDKSDKIAVQLFYDHTLNSEELWSWCGASVIRDFYEGEGSLEERVERATQRLERDERDAAKIQERWEKGIDGWQAFLCTAAVLSAAVLILGAL